MRRLILGVVGLLVLAAAVWSQAPRIARVLRKEVQLTRRELPGAALLFPAGKAVQEKIDYAEGMLEIQFGSTGRANLTWSHQRDAVGRRVRDHAREAAAGVPGRVAGRARPGEGRG